jgi:hypothetical protein
MKSASENIRELLNIYGTLGGALYDPYLALVLRQLYDQVVELEDDSIIVNDSEGNEICVIDGEMAEQVRVSAVSRYISEALLALIEREKGGSSPE